MFPRRLIRSSLRRFVRAKPLPRGDCHCRRAFSSRLLERYLQVDDRVEEALLNGDPVVALESTIVAHGMPYPQNLETAEDVEAIVKSKGAEPATIAVLNGKARIGLLPHELQDLAKAGEENRAAKCSTRELPLVLGARRENAGKNEWGATTVASTMTLAHAAGIASFVTGGIGGVHRNGHISMDVSADLTELSRTPVVVISAGIKSILDIPRTLEVLETNAVPTVAFQTDEFPCFFSPNSGVMAPASIESADEVAAAYWASRALNLSNGMLVAVPPPDPAGHAIEEAIREALAEAEAQGIHGQAVTPFILKRVAETTKGVSLRCNISLVKRNAEVGSDIAIAIAKHKNATAVGVTPPEYSDELRSSPTPSRVVVMGGTVLDIVAKPEFELIMGTSNPAVCTESDGGVARNIAEVLGRLGSVPLLYSAVGRDARGYALQQRQEDYGIQHSHLTIQSIEGANTATYLAVLEGDTNDLHTACADMSVMDKIEPPPRDILEKAEMLVLDANPPLHVLKEAARSAAELDVDVYFEPTSVPKARLCAQDHEFLRYLNGAFPNLDELRAMRDAACNTRSSDSRKREEHVAPDFEAVETMATELLQYLSPAWAYLVITMGEHGVMLASRGSESDTCQFRYFPIEEEVEVQNSTGAGDSLCGGFLHAILQGKDVSEAISLGMMAATVSLCSSERTIAAELSALRENS